MKITRHAQSCFFIETMYSKLLIDPGSFVFDEEGKKPADFKETDLIIVTHEHSDHFDWENIQKIMDLSGCDIIGTSTVSQIVSKKYPNRAGNIGAGFKHKVGCGVEVEGFLSKHGPLPNGDTPPNVSGVIVSDGENSFYTPGDTIFLNPKADAKIIAVPICGEVVMDIETAKQQLLLKKPEITIPIHYDNPRYPVDVNDFVKTMENTGIDVRVLKWGGSIDI